MISQSDRNDITGQNHFYNGYTRDFESLLHRLSLSFMALVLDDSGERKKFISFVANIDMFSRRVLTIL